MAKLELVTPLTPRPEVTAKDIPRLVMYLVPDGDEHRAQTLVKFAATIAREADANKLQAIYGHMVKLSQYIEKKNQVLWEVRSAVRRWRDEGAGLKPLAGHIAELVDDGNRDQAVALADLTRVLIGEPSDALRESIALAISDECFRHTNAYGDAALRYFKSVVFKSRSLHEQAV